MNLRNDLAWAIIAAASLAVLWLTYGPLLALAALIGIVFAWWAWEYPEEAFLTLVALSPLLPMLKVTQTVGNATLIKDVLIITLFFKTALVPFLAKTLPYRRNIFFAPIVALSSWAVFEVLHAHVSTLSILRLRDIALYILLYFAVLYLPHSKERMKVRGAVFFATVGITITLGIFQFLHLPDSTVLRFDPARSIWIPRVASTFAHPTVFAEYLITAIALCVGIIASKKLRPNLQTITLATLGAASTILLYFTYTRAAWVAFAAAVVAMGITMVLPTNTNIQFKPMKKYIALACGILIILAVGVIRFTPVGTFLATAFDPNYASNADRIVFVVNLLSKTSNTNAVIGKGLGNTITQAYQGGDATAIDIASGESRTIQVSKDQTLVDNQYLKTFIEMGVVGIVFTLWLFWRFALACRAALMEGTTLSRTLGIAGVGFLVAFMVQALFVDIWDVYPTNALFWALAALVSVSSAPLVNTSNTIAK